MNTPTERLAAEGVSVWLDHVSRPDILSGKLARLIATRHVTGATTDPTTFANALSTGQEYEAQVDRLARRRVPIDEAIFSIATVDVRSACDLFLPIYDATAGVDGRVSIDVSPELAHDTEGIVAQAKELWSRVDSPNVLIKIPATTAGLPAITEVIGAGISVDVTLIFGRERYGEVIDAYLAGLEKAGEAGIDLSGIHSVASFFVSDVDSEVDRRLAAIGTDEADALASRAGLANARLAYELYKQRFAEERAAALLAAGANVQRLLWASTSVGDAAWPDTTYIAGLVAPDTVCTLPEKTLGATLDRAEITGDVVTGGYAEARAVFERLAAIGVDVDDVARVLERKCVQRSIASWYELQQTVYGVLAPLKAA
ncbi:transaldolase [Phytoactinopolyspora halotolerans]|uniref:Transaldolase n=1 Tax=Phytoactinopolyspora halotolerans TaxID=1981512 RepID=A0A6L9S8B8_9ACTN|nr:transaldolase [Phytoactinopolyspora halotolerans]NEE00812.1 transaldolase [Phytoactinopolyspora halotolerans]